ncbi:MAG: adenylate/guanylate cyclase domain-containing protein [Pseudomonadota bacterium]
MRGLLKLHGKSIALGFILVLLTISVHLSTSGWLQAAVSRLDYLVYDLRLRATQARPPESSDVIIIDIDERALREYGRWPWSRLTIADLVTRLHQFGAAVIGFDVNFAEPEQNIVASLLDSQALSSASSRQRAWLASLTSSLDRDGLLANSLRGKPVVLGVFFGNDPSEQKGQLPPPWFFIKPAQEENHQMLNMPGFTANLPAIQANAEFGGFLNATPDDDGVMRRTPLVLRQGQFVYPSLALAMARIYNNAVRFKVRSVEVQGSQFVTGLELEDQFIPTDRFGRINIRYFGAGYTFPYMSAAEVLGATSLNDLPQLQGKAVIVGTTALGLYDLRATPLAAAFPGVEVQASILQTLIRSDLQFPIEPDWEDALILFVLIVIGTALSFLAPLLQAVWLVVLSILLLAGIILGDIWLWAAKGISVSPVMPVSLVLALLLLNLVRGFIGESSRRQAVQGMFGQYVPAAHIDRMLANPDAVTFEGETREMSVLFADIRNFTTISESLDAVQLKAMLNEFFTPITQIIFDSGGTVDKYIGDLVMAFWGAPLEDEHHRRHSISAALTMLRKVEELRPGFVAKGYPEIHIGIGINSGPMNVGDMGSSYRRAYTVIGDAVNLGSRLEGLTKYYGVNLLVGEETRREQDDFLYHWIDRVQVKGKDQPVDVYEPICLRSEATDVQIALAEAHTEAMRLYMAGKVPEARAAFTALNQREETQQTTIMLGRISELDETGVDETWSGVFKHATK